MSHSKRIVGLYEENAATWDRQRPRDLHEAAWLERFAAFLPAGGSVLDIGCGMGEPVARWFIARGYKITGVDSAPSLIALARNRFPAMEWVVADMRRLDLGRVFDGVMAWHSFFHLAHDDQRAMFPIFAAHAVSGAPLMFTSGTSHGEAIGEWMGEPLYHGSLAPEEYRARLAANAFAEIAHTASDPECGGSTVWLAAKQ